MGSDRKSRDSTRKRSPSPLTEDEGQQHKRHKKDKKEKSHRSKSDKDKHHHHHSKKDKSEKKHKSKRSKHEDILPLAIDIKELSADDYFSKNNEFATWLKERKNKFFSDLSSDSARELFSEFVERYNSKKLDIKYYEGIETAPRSSHKWKFKKSSAVSIDGDDIM